MTDQAADVERSAAPAVEVGTPEGRRVLELLWDPPAANTRGPKAKVTLPEIVRAGVALADADGLEALSMRAVAGRLGIGAMSLYTYVPGRAELVELMVDAAYAEHPLPDPTQPWRTRLEFSARERWRLVERHPWLLELNTARLPVGPHVFDVEEAQYAAIAASGLRGVDVVSVANLITWQVLGAARTRLADSVEERRTGTSAEAYWESRASFWTTHFTPDRFPTMQAIWDVGGFDDERGHSFEIVIGRLLDAVEIMIDRSRARD